VLTAREFAAEFAGTTVLLLAALSAVCADFAVGSPVVTAMPNPGLQRPNQLGNESHHRPPEQG